NQIGSLNTTGEFQGKTANEIGRIGAGITTASGKPVDNALVASNAESDFPAVLLLLLLILSLINFYTYSELVI
ncbi:11522_t:CDS:2, partial [Funneliformis geosporum]